MFPSKRSSRALATMVMSVVACAGCTRQQSRPSREQTAVLSGPANTMYPMPPLKSGTLSETGWVSEDNLHSKLADYHGKVLVLDFYATWCLPCRESVPHLTELQRRYGSQGLEVVGLNVGGPNDRIKVADFAREFHIKYPLSFPDKSLTDVLLSDSDAIPQTFVFDRQGLLVKRLIGYDEASGKELEQVIETAIASGSR